MADGRPSSGRRGCRWYRHLPRLSGSPRTAPASSAGWRRAFRGRLRPLPRHLRGETSPDRIFIEERGRHYEHFRALGSATSRNRPLPLAGSPGSSTTAGCASTSCRQFLTGRAAQRPREEACILAGDAQRQTAHWAPDLGTGALSTKRRIIRGSGRRDHDVMRRAGFSPAGRNSRGRYNDFHYTRAFKKAARK